MSKAKVIKGLLSLFKQKTSKNKAKRIIESEMPGDEFFGKQPVAADPTAAKFKKLPETLEAEAEARKAILKLKQLGFMDETGGITEKALNPRGKAVNKLDDILERNKNDDPFKSLDEFYKKETGVDYATSKKNVNPLQEEMDRMLELEKANLNESLNKLKIQSAEMEEMTKVLDEFNRIADEDGMEAALKAMEGLMNPKRTLNAAGGRIGMGFGGQLGKGIMQAVKQAKKGFKPFGEKQTYKQNLQNLGLANEKALVSNFANKLDKIMKTRQSQIPEEDLYDLFENIATGKQYDMVSTPIKKDMLAAVMQAMRKRNVDGSDFQNFIADIAPKTKRDILPNDVQSLLKQIDESDAFMEQLRGKPSSKIVPFKPKTKKANGGTIPPQKGPVSNGMGSLFRRK